MSFILDALRKSDAERQRTVTPGLADVRYAGQHARRKPWLPVLAVVVSVVLVANVVFMALQWYGRNSPPATSAATVAAPAAAPAVAPAAEPAVTPQANIRPLARETGLPDGSLEEPMDQDYTVAPMVVEMAEPEREGRPLAAAAPAPQPPAPARAEGTASASPSRIIAGNELPTVEQLIGSGAMDIPMLNLDLHVYSDRTAARFVVINGRKYKEGGQLTEGPTVETITADGVVLSRQGRRFTLSRK